MREKACPYEARLSRAEERVRASGLELADILREHGQAYLENHVVSVEQLAALRAVVDCRTAALGGHMDRCAHCGYERPSYNSCGHRMCPKCQALEQARWVEERAARILPVAHFHLVFTLPHELNPLALRNPAVVYDLLFAAAWAALKEVLADPKHLGGLPAVTMVLHTWTQELRLHPHLHVIVSGGGLAPDGTRWVATRKKTFLVAKRVLAALLRGRFLDGLRKAWEAGSLDLGGACAPLAAPAAFERLLSRLYAKDWLVYAKRPFGGPEHVMRYLGRYTHRTGISNGRLVSMEAGTVRFRKKDGSVVVLPAEEFIRRFLLHVLPSRFVRIRHFGLLAASNVNTKLAAAREALRPGEPAPFAEKLGWRERMLRLTGTDPMACPACGQTLDRREVLEPVRHALMAGRPVLHLPEVEDSS